ncbi:hypothetical protein BC829DRAFT_402341 [Chytridium lagenaria]|nr:hypothetical protein BC829DRAFT_402341 [Chytridium lagenaria]
MAGSQVDREESQLYQWCILRKGLGLCHGIGGNGYAFLFAWKGFRAWRRRETVEQPRDHEILTLIGMRHFETLLNVPDHPWSLFEGVLGFACYLMDVGLVVDGKEGMGFPGYDLS